MVIWVRTFIEFIVVVAIIYGYMHEDEVIQFEQRIKHKLHDWKGRNTK